MSLKTVLESCEISPDNTAASYSGVVGYMLARIYTINQSINDPRLTELIREVDEWKDERWQTIKGRDN